MPKLAPDQIPSYRLHRQSGQAVVTLCGRDVLLGAHGSRASREKYARVTAEWIANGRQLRADPASATVSMVISCYWKHCGEYYAGDSGDGERRSIKLALGFVRRLYGSTPAAQFGPLALKAVRQAMVDAGWSRNYVNAQVSRIRRMFAWGVENEMVPGSVHLALRAVAGLRKGKCAARESEGVRAVPEAHVYAIKDHVNDRVWAMIELQMITGMRPGEVCIMRTGDIDTTGKLWVYTPHRHKTEHHGHVREIYLGPRAQAIVAPFLKTDLQAFIFSPSEAEAARREKLHAERKTPLSCGNRPGSNRVRSPGRRPGDSYDVPTYRRAIERACDKAWPPPAPLCQAEDETRDQWRKRLTKEQRAALAKWRAEHRWHPHQVRHRAGTDFRKTYGLEAAQCLLGHKTLTAAQIYAEKNVATAKQIMAEVG